MFFRRKSIDAEIAGLERRRDGLDRQLQELEAKLFAGATDRNLRKLIEKGRIDVRGEGQNRQMSVASLRRYFAV
jgi:hypothetical protein